MNKNKYKYGGEWIRTQKNKKYNFKNAHEETCGTHKYFVGQIN